MFGGASKLLDDRVLDDLERAIDKVAASELVLELSRLRRLADRLEAAWTHAARVAERSGALDEISRSHATVLAAGCRLSFMAARRVLHAGRTLEELPLTADAFAAGEITPEHVRVLVGAYTPERAVQLRDLEADLVDAARRFTAKELSMIVRRVCDAIDGDDGAASANAEFERRELHVSHAFARSGVINGQLDPEGTETAICALETRMADDPDTPGERRTRPQRRADAFVDICRHYLATRDHDTSDRRGGLPHAGIVVDLQHLAADGHANLVADIRGELEHVGHISKATLRRLTCDAHVHRVLTDGTSQPLDVGRATRTVSSAMWRALVARDRHCTAPGCDRPSGWCQAHHIRHWADGGNTSLDNLTLLCWRHHRDHHEGAARGP
jgi:hypothetical protein